MEIARGEPDARPPWSPPVDPVSRDHTDQVRAIIESGHRGLRKKKGGMLGPISLSRSPSTLAEMRAVLQDLKPVAAQVQKEKGVPRCPKSSAPMIEIPRAALTAGEIATEAEFFSFGTNA